MNKSEFEANACSRHQARENTYDHVMIGFDLVSHWLKKWRKTKAITKITFDTQLKTALCKAKSLFLFIILVEVATFLLTITLITRYFPFVLYLVFNFLTDVMYIISATDFPFFCSNLARKCLILPAESSPQKSLILLEILPAEFIQAY